MTLSREYIETFRERGPCGEPIDGGAGACAYDVTGDGDGGARLRGLRLLFIGVVVMAKLSDRPGVPNHLPADI